MNHAFLVMARAWRCRSKSVVRHPMEGRRVNESQFWKVVSAACGSAPEHAEEWAGRLQAELQKLPPDQIIGWNHIFDRHAAEAYTVGLWSAAYLINGGASDDGFYYFRCWLIGMGRKVFEAAVADPDSLADVVVPGVDAEAETYAAAHLAWIEVTGRSDSDPYPARNEHATLIGEDWDFEDKAQMRRRLPRLAALYLE